LSFVAGKFDLTSWYFLQVPMLKDVKAQDPEAICELVPSNVNRNVMMNRQAPPFDNPELRRAVALTLDRKAFVDTLTLGKGDYAVGLNLTGNGLDDPDQTLYENFTCGAEGNYDRYCNPELDKMVDRQSMEFDQIKRKELVWAVERKLAEDAARPILWHNRSGTCWHPYVKGYTPMINSIYNGLRMEDVWLDK